MKQQFAEPCLGRDQPCHPQQDSLGRLNIRALEILLGVCEPMFDGYVYPKNRMPMFAYFPYLRYAKLLGGERLTRTRASFLQIYVGSQKRLTQAFQCFTTLQDRSFEPVALLIHLYLYLS
jgi:hypothetical protein